MQYEQTQEHDKEKGLRSIGCHGRAFIGRQRSWFEKTLFTLEL